MALKIEPRAFDFIDSQRKDTVEKKVKEYTGAQNTKFSLSSASSPPRTLLEAPPG